MHPERDDAAYQLRREEVGELRGKRCNAGREVAAFVVCDAAGVDHSLDIRVTVVWIGGETGAGAQDSNATIAELPNKHAS